MFSPFSTESFIPIMLFRADFYPYKTALSQKTCAPTDWVFGGRLERNNQYLPLDVVLPIENLLQKRDKSECANKHETQRSTAEDVFTRRRVGVAGSAAQHPGSDGDTRSGVSPRCIQDRDRICPGTTNPDISFSLHYFSLGVARRGLSINSSASSHGGSLY